MVRKKQSSTFRTNIFAPPGKVMMIEKSNGWSNKYHFSQNKALTPLKTPISTKSPAPQYSNSSQNKSKQSSVLNSSKKRKSNQSLKALREIKKYQGSTRLLIPKAPFSRVVREISQNICGKMDIRFTELSLMALQEATEMAIVNLLEIANLCCAHAKRVTLTPADIRLTRRAFGLTSSLNA